MVGQRGFRTADEAREVRARGLNNEAGFVAALGGGRVYRNDATGKRDVIDPSGDAHSVKSGVTKWQIFLYARHRFESDDGFQALNGVGELLIHCLDTMPDTFEEYQQNKDSARRKLQTPMRELKDRFQRKALLRAFLMKSIFNGGEVNYLTALHDDRYHVFLNTEAVQLMGEQFEVVNSVAKGPSSPPDQKVLFRVGGKNVGELEMRTDQKQYQRVRFNMIVPRIMELLLTIHPTEDYNAQVVVHGQAIRRFGRWQRD